MSTNFPPEPEPEIKEDKENEQSQLPPEAQGETNGGPLGCCLGTCVGLLASVLIALLARLYPGMSNGFLLSNLRLIMACAGLIGVVVFGYIGWKVGKRLYKEYEPPVVKVRRRKKKPAAKAVK